MVFAAPTMAAKRATSPASSGGVGSASMPGLLEQAIRRQRQELEELLGEDEPVEELRRLRQPRIAGQLADLLVADLLVELGRDLPAVVERGAAVDPEPELRARDLGGRRVLHEVEDRDRAVPAQPRRQVLQ